MSGYTNPYILLQFPELGDDCSILMRNPQLMPPSKLTPDDVALGENGQPLDPQAANKSMFKVMAGLIVAWKVYEAFGDAGPDIAPDADPVELMATLGSGTQPRIGEISAENVAKLPLAVINSIGEEIGRVANPK